MLYAVVLGGALGSAARYGLAGLVQRSAPGVFPWGTLSVNLLGSLVIGILFGLFEKSPVPLQLRAFLFVGILGGFTTFSSFGIETASLVRDAEYRLALAYILLTNLLGVALVFAGLAASRALWNYMRG